jgi:hypothetical protein
MSTETDPSNTLACLSIVRKLSLHCQLTQWSFLTLCNHNCSSYYASNNQARIFIISRLTTRNIRTHISTHILHSQLHHKSYKLQLISITKINYQTANMSYYHPSSIIGSSRHQDPRIPSGYSRSNTYSTSHQDQRSTGNSYSASHQARSSYTPPRRSYTTGPSDPYHRSISPPHSHAEQPRSNVTSRQYADHRSVSPLGSSRFEESIRRDPKRALTMREIPQMGHDGYYGASDATQQFTGKGLARSNAVRGRANERGFGGIGYSKGVQDVRRHGGEFSSAQWERY